MGYAKKGYVAKNPNYISHYVTN